MATFIKRTSFTRCVDAGALTSARSPRARRIKSSLTLSRKSVYRDRYVDEVIGGRTVDLLT
jgi:hypothetical protein